MQLKNCNRKAALTSAGAVGVSVAAAIGGDAELRILVAFVPSRRIAQRRREQRGAVRQVAIRRRR